MEQWPQHQEPVIRLHGSPVSNCYNTVLAALRHKGLPHEENHTGASTDAGFLQLTPMGKIPFITVGELSISETSAIVEYLDDRFPEHPPLFPGTLVERARQRQMMKFVELYIESPGRRLFPGVFWFMDNEPIHIAEVRPIMERGLNAVDVLLKNNRFFYEDRLTAADFYSYFSLQLIAHVTLNQYQWNLFKSRPHIARYVNRVESAPFLQTIVAQRDAAMETYLEKKRQEAEHRGP